MVTAVNADDVSPPVGAGLALVTGATETGAMETGAMGTGAMGTGAIEAGAAKENETGAFVETEATDAEVSGICFCRLKLLIRGCTPMVRAFCSKLIEGVEGGVMSST